MLLDKHAALIGATLPNKQRNEEKKNAANISNEYVGLFIFEANIRPSTGDEKWRREKKIFQNQTIFYSILCT